MLVSASESTATTWSAISFGTSVSSSPSIRTLGAKPSTGAASPTTRTTRARRPGPVAFSRAQAEDRRPDDLDGLVEVVHRPRHAFGGLLVLDEAACALQGHTGGEQPLDRQVVQVPGDSVAVLEHGDLLGVLAAFRQLHGDGGLGGEGLEGLGLLRREHGGRPASRASRTTPRTPARPCRSARRQRARVPRSAVVRRDAFVVATSALVTGPPPEKASPIRLPSTGSTSPRCASASIPTAISTASGPVSSIGSGDRREGSIR